MSSTITVQGVVSTVLGQQQINLSQLIVSPLGQSTLPNLTNGSNIITVPSGSTLALIQLPPQNAQTVTLKGVAGDTGILLNKNGLNMLALDPSVATFVLFTGGAINFPTLITFL